MKILAICSIIPWSTGVSVCILMLPVMYTFLTIHLPQKIEKRKIQTNKETRQDKKRKTERKDP